jgi:protein TonB
VVIDRDVTPIKFVEPNRQAPPPVMKKPALPKPPVATIVNPPPVIVPNDNFISKSPTVEELTVISDSAVQGTGTEASPVTTPSKTEGNGKDEQKGNSDAQPEIIRAPDVAPEFPGGPEGWTRFLKRNLRPKESDEAYNVTVIINFVVNEDGTLSDLKIIRSGGTEFDNEVLRVMRKSPTWNAGIYHGNKVKVYHAQPVIFINRPDE